MMDIKSEYFRLQTIFIFKFRNSRNLHVIAIIAIIARTRIIKMVPKDNVSVNPRIVEIVNY